MFDFLRLIKIILGGMGVYISSPFLVNAFSKACEKLGINGLGTVSGTAAERIMVLILQRGDPGGHYRRALAHFPFADVAERVVSEYYDATGCGKKTAPVYRIDPSRKWIELAVTANFAFVWLSKEGHNQPVSINYLEKIAIPLIYYVTGAMMAGVDVVTMGAGVILKVPGVFDALLQNRTLRYPIPVIGINGEHETTEVTFNPWEFFGRDLPPMKRPAFLPIVSSHVLAQLYADKIPADSLQGFVIERHTAGGHNAPPRGRVTLDSLGQPIYGPRDEVDFKEVKKLNFPFWIGGSCASRKSIAWAISEGAQGFQIGTAFALCEESGMNKLITQEVRRNGYRGVLVVLKNPRISPTSYPFNVAIVRETISERDIYESEIRLCNQGALVSCYRLPDGSIGYRCPSEPIVDYLRKGGKIEDTIGRSCLCGSLMEATEDCADCVPTATRHPKHSPVVTMGVDTGFLRDLMPNENGGYSVEDAIRHLMGI